MEFWYSENGTWITRTQIRQINNPPTSGRWCLCLHNLNKTMLHMWPIKWDEIKCYWQWVVMTEQEGKKLNFECAGAKLAPAEKKAGWLFVAALLPVELQPVFSLQRKESLQGWQWFNRDVLFQPLGCECCWGCQWSARVEEICLLHIPVCWELDQARMHWHSCLWERQGQNYSFLLSWIFNDFSPSGCAGRWNKALRWLIRRRDLWNLSFRAHSYCTVSALYFPPKHFCCKHVVMIKMK